MQTTNELSKNVTKRFKQQHQPFYGHRTSQPVLVSTPQWTTGVCWRKVSPPACPCWRQLAKHHKNIIDVCSNDSIKHITHWCSERWWTTQVGVCDGRSSTVDSLWTATTWQMEICVTTAQCVAALSLSYCNVHKHAQSVFKRPSWSGFTNHCR